MPQCRMQPLKDGYGYRDVDEDEFRPHFERLRPQVFGATFTFRAQEALSEAERGAAGSLHQRLGTERFVLRLGVYQGDELVGWHIGRQEDAEKFYMTNTAFLPAHQGRGLYTALLPLIIERVSAEGFQVINSRHTATNNRVIVPKLKAGFIITSLEVDDRFGTLVHLSYYTNPLRRKMMDVRSGEARLGEDLLPYV
jgi:GNAT superfamily N-acetyltransferase